MKNKFCVYKKQCTKNTYKKRVPERDSPDWQRTKTIRNPTDCSLCPLWVHIPADYVILLRKSMPTKKARTLRANSGLSSIVLGFLR